MSFFGITPPIGYSGPPYNLIQNGLAIFTIDTDAVDQNPDPRIGQYQGTSLILTLGTFTQFTSSVTVVLSNDNFGTACSPPPGGPFTYDTIGIVYRRDPGFFH